MRKKAFVMLTALTLLFTTVSSRACEMTPSCLGITAKITRGIARIIRDIYHVHHNNNNNRNNDGDTNLAPRNIIEEMINNIDNNSQNHNRHTATRTRRSNNG